MHSTSTAVVDPTTTARPKESAVPRLFSRGGLLCVAIFCVCLLIIWPVAEIGVNDDWIYTITAYDFARTGHFIFHGWASPMLGWQAMWGALFTKLFGTTYTAVRLSIAPVAAFTVLIYHAILRRFGLNVAHATLGTLAFALSPVFLPLSASFMTDVPAILPILLCLYFCQLAIAAPTETRTVFWLVAAALSNVALGTVRQVAWFGLLVMLPSCIWLLRRRRYVVPVGIALWLAGALCIHFLLNWFQRQPFTAPEKLIAGPLSMQLVPIVAGQVAGALMTALLLSSPVLTLGLVSAWPLRRPVLIRGLTVLAALAVLVAVFHHAGKSHVIQFPWLGNTFAQHGILEEGLSDFNHAMPSVWQSVLFFFVVICTVASLEAFFGSVNRVPSSQAERVPSSTPSWSQISVLLLPCVACYCVLLLPRAAFFILFDRYLLEVVAILLIYPLRWHQEHFSYRIPALSTVTVVLMAILTVADTHDLFAGYRAEVRLGDELQQNGVPRSAIRGGFAYDSQTQVAAWGYVNDPRILNPPGAYHPKPKAVPYKRDGVWCGYSWEPYLPALHTRYVIVSELTPCFAPSHFAPQTYHAWLPPMKRELYAGILLPREDERAK